MSKLKEAFIRTRDRLTGKIKNLIQRRNINQQVKKTLPPTKSEFELITTDLIDETFSKDGEMWNRFLKLISDYDSENNPMGKDYAEAVLEAILKMSVNGQLLLSDRVIEAFRAPTNRDRINAREKGYRLPDLMADYNEKISEISMLADEVETARQDLRVAQGPYEEENEHLEEVIRFGRENRRKRKKGYSQKADYWQADLQETESLQPDPLEPDPQQPESLETNSPETDSQQGGEQQ